MMGFAPHALANGSQQVYEILIFEVYEVSKEA